MSFINAWTRLAVAATSVDGLEALAVAIVMSMEDTAAAIVGARAAVIAADGLGPGNTGDMNLRTGSNFTTHSF